MNFKTKNLVTGFIRATIGCVLILVGAANISAQDNRFGTNTIISQTQSNRVANHIFPRSPGRYDKVVSISDTSERTADIIDAHVNGRFPSNVVSILYYDGSPDHYSSTRYRLAQNSIIIDAGTALESAIIKRFDEMLATLDQVSEAEIKKAIASLASQTVVRNLRRETEVNYTLQSSSVGSFYAGFLGVYTVEIPLDAVNVLISGSTRNNQRASLSIEPIITPNDISMTFSTVESIFQTEPRILSNRDLFNRLMQE